MSHGIRTLIVLFVCQWFASPAENARILALETIAGKSHWNFMSAVLKSLTDAGHNVTVFTPFPDGGDRANYTIVDTSEDYPSIVELNIMELIENFSQPMTLINSWAPISRMYCDMVYGNNRLAEIMKNGHNRDFDLIIMEPYALDCPSYLASTLNIPIIFIIPSPMILLIEFFSLGHIPNPSYVSNMLADYAVPKTFVQRFNNVVQLLYGHCTIKYQEMKLKKTDPKPYDSAPTVYPSLIFINTHYITEAPRPVSPNLISIGGIHLKSPETIPNSLNAMINHCIRKTILREVQSDNDLLDFIEDSTHGVIYFTFGSTVKLSSLPGHIEEAFKQAFAQVPQKVLWKYEGEMIDKPKNVMIRNWFPQREVLLHPNIKLFISHGGISGIYESVDAGVPILGFPLFYDQPRNIDHLVHNEMAISMDLLTVTKDKLLNAITELINNTKYMENSKINSLRFKDRPMSPQQSVVYWTEYVIRHKGAPHLKSHSLNLTWYQYFMLDVILLFLIIICLITFIIYKIVILIFNYTVKRLYNNNKVKSE